MQTELDSHEALTTAIRASPHQLNQLTQRYLQYLKSSSYTPNTATWEALQIVMKQMNEQQTEIQICVLLFNVAKLVLNQTLGSMSGVKDNKIYSWMSMLYGVKCDAIVRKIELARAQLEEAGEDYQKQTDERQLLHTIGCGLLLSQIIISLNQKSNRMSTSNRVIYPQFYRLMNYNLQCLIKFIHPSLDTIIQTNVLSTDTEKDTNKIIIKTTAIMEMLQQIESNKKKTGIRERYMVHEKAAGMLIAKVVELITRSFQICRCKPMKRMHIISQSINAHLSQFMGEQHKNGKQDITLEGTILRNVIADYLGQFKEKQQNNQTAMHDQIDEDNKIIQVKELTPRFVDEGPIMELKKLRTKKKKLIKKIQSDSRTATLNRLQEQQVVQDVRNERAARRQKKEIFIMQKQTQQAKKQHNKMKKIKQIQKEGGKGTKGGKHNNKNSKQGISGRFKKGGR